MKKIISLSKIHDNKKYEDQLFQLNINPIFYNDVIRHSTICMNADIIEQYVNIPVQFQGILCILKQRVYIDTRTNIMYDHVEPLDEHFAYYINMKTYQGINDDIIRHFEEFKPLNDDKFYLHEDHYALYKKIMGEE